MSHTENGDEPENCTDHDHKHDHDHDHGHDGDAQEQDQGVSSEILMNALVAARTGLRSQVQTLVDVLPLAHVYIPLAEDIPDAEEGKEMTWDGQLTFRPHMILSPEEDIFAVAYSDPELVEEMAEALEWDTSGAELKLVCVPMQVAFDLCALMIDQEPVTGLVFNPGTENELLLQREEAASIAQGVALPLVGYVAELPAEEDEGAHVVKGAAEPPPELMSALSAVTEAMSEVRELRVETTFNKERDREPHLTVFLTVVPGCDKRVIADRLMEKAGDLIPPPGYADIVFRDVPN